MAYKEGQYCYADEDTLGKYKFTVKTRYESLINKTVLTAQCWDEYSHAEKFFSLDGNVKMDSFYVDANNTTADVYANMIFSNGASCSEHNPTIGEQFATGVYRNGRQIDNRYWICTRADEPVLAGWVHLSHDDWNSPILIGTNTSNVAGTVFYFGGTHAMETRATSIINGITFVLLSGGSVHTSQGNSISGDYLGEFYDQKDALTKLVDQFFEFDEEIEPVLVGRFLIDLGDAGGTGEGSDWEDPEDEEPEEEEPTYTLYLEIEGALSGRHNDPLHDTSFSYIPADKDTHAYYGCGGDGGNGGGGGGGASTVIVYKFATDQANSKEITVMPKRHGYGSGGGKGGKGGDGCILIYY